MSVTGKWIKAAAALAVIISASARAAEPPPLQIAAIGDLTLESGAVLRDAKLGYRTEGTLNAERSNAILFPTWFTGTTAALYAAGAVATIDTSKFFLITVDAFGNGVSSSPSNNDSFTEVSIRDKVLYPGSRSRCRCLQLGDARSRGELCPSRCDWKRTSLQVFGSRQRGTRSWRRWGATSTSSDSTHRRSCKNTISGARALSVSAVAMRRCGTRPALRATTPSISPKTPSSSAPRGVQLRDRTEVGRRPPRLLAGQKAPLYRRA